MNTKKSTSQKPTNSGDVNPRDHESLVAQLEALYSERERLHAELGISDADSIVTMVRSLTAQLNALYQQKDDGSA